MKKVIIVIVFVIVIGGGYFGLKSMADNPDDIIVNSIDLSKVQDGVYVGHYKSAMVSAKVEVTVKDNKIVEIKISQHDCGLGTKAEGIVDDVVNAQTLEVDTVSGATLSSKVILKAVEDALT